MGEPAPNAKTLSITIKCLHCGSTEGSARAIRLPHGRWSVMVFQVEPMPGTNEEVMKEVPDFFAQS